MATRLKLKIVDDCGLRSEIDALYEKSSQIVLAQWAIQCAKHILNVVDLSTLDCSSITHGFYVSELWQAGKASVHEVRQAGFSIHAFARQCPSVCIKNAIRTAGQAVGVGHMREHAMVCSDYAVKTVQLAFPGRLEKISEERQWQMNCLNYYNDLTINILHTNLNELG